MNRLVSIFVFAATTSLVIACAANPAPASSSAAHVVDREAPSQSACPAPKPTTDACAAVMVYVKVGDTCCAYADPCSAPDGQKFSDDRCLVT